MKKLENHFFQILLFIIIGLSINTRAQNKVISLWKSPITGEIEAPNYQEQEIYHGIKVKY